MKFNDGEPIESPTALMEQADGRIEISEQGQSTTAPSPLPETIAAQ